MNKEQVLFTKLHPQPITNSGIPRIEVDTIYKIGTFDFIKVCSVKTHEEVISLQSGLQTIGLIKQNSITNHLKANYRFMHIGLVQVTINHCLKEALMLQLTWR